MEMAARCYSWVIVTVAVAGAAMTYPGSAANEIVTTAGPLVRLSA